MAELWVHKVPDILDSHNQTFVVSEVAHWDTNRSFQKTKPIAIQETYISGRGTTGNRVHCHAKAVTRGNKKARDEFDK